MAADVQNTWPAKVANLGQLPFQQKLGLILTIAAIVALVAGAWMWGKSPDYRVLYGNLSDRDGGAVIEALEKSNTPYKFTDGGGAIMVPAEHVYEARLRLASQGLPKGGLIGFEVMENQKLGTSQFQEQVNYQRALEGELARSIQSLSAVRGARVHLAISKPSVFVREQTKPSASVLLDLFPGKTLDGSQVSAITHLVSSSVPELTAKNVTLVDQAGNLLSTPSDGSANAALDSSQLKYIAEIEQNYANRVESIVTPIVGAGNVRAQVTADLDFSQVEHTAETYKPNQTAADSAIRSQHVTETVGNGGQTTGGIPGALSNQPPANATAPVIASAAGTAAGGNQNDATVKQTNLNKESTVNYEVDKTIRYTRQSSGTLKRLSIAVVVNQRKVTDDEGTVTYKPLAEAEMKHINELVKEAVGYNKDRGDTLNIVNSAFTEPDPVEIPETPIWKQPGTISMAKSIGKNLLIALVALYIFLGVLRPLLKYVSQPPENMPISPEMQQQLALLSRQQAAVGYENNLQAAKQIAQQDPKVVANVVKGWIGDGR